MISKSLAAALVLSLAGLAACTPPARQAITLVEGDITLGPADAKVVLVEYGAPTCPVCKRFHEETWPQIKASYVDTGKVKFAFREYPVHGAMDAAISSVARCAGPEDFFKVLDEAFKTQDEIVREAQQTGGSIKALKKLGEKFRLSGEQVEACIKDPKNLARIIGVMEEAASRGIGSTPTFLLNEREISGQAGLITYREMAAEIDAALAGASAPGLSPGPAPGPAPGLPPAPSQATPAIPPSAPN